MYILHYVLLIKPLFPILIILDEIFNAGAPGYHLLTQRDLGAGAKERKEREKDREDHRLQVSTPPF